MGSCASIPLSSNLIDEMKDSSPERQKTGEFSYCKYFPGQGFFYPDYTGTHYFRTTSDDASHVVINGTTVVNNGGTHGSQTVQGSISLNSGTVNKIEIYFGEAAGGDNMTFEHYINSAWTVDLHRYFRG